MEQDRRKLARSQGLVPPPKGPAAHAAKPDGGAVAGPQKGSVAASRKASAGAVKGPEEIGKDSKDLFTMKSIMKQVRGPGGEWETAYGGLLVGPAAAYSV